MSEPKWQILDLQILDCPHFFLVSGMQCRFNLLISQQTIHLTANLTGIEFHLDTTNYKDPQKGWLARKLNKTMETFMVVRPDIVDLLFISGFVVSEILHSTNDENVVGNVHPGQHKFQFVSL